MPIPPRKPIKPIQLWCWSCPRCGYTMIMHRIDSETATTVATCHECDQQSEIFTPKGEGRITYPEDLRAGLTKEQIDWMDGVFDRQLAASTIDLTCEPKETKKMSYEQAVKEIWVWQYNDTGSFFSLLIFLFRKADYNNKAILRAAYPNLFQALQDWEAADDNGRDLFRKYGLMN